MSNFYDEISGMLGDSNPDKAPTKEENLECLRRAVEGSDEAVDEFIVSNMRLVGAVVAKFTTIHPEAKYLSEDMFGEGLLVLTQVVNRWVEWLRGNEEIRSQTFDTSDSDSPNILGYMYISIYRNVQECYEIESSDAISKKMRKRNTPRGCSSPTRKINLPDEYFDKQICNPFEVIYILEDILELCETGVERGIVNGALNSIPSKEVMETLGISQSTYFLKRQQLYRRFCKQTGLGWAGLRLKLE